MIKNGKTEENYMKPDLLKGYAKLLKDWILFSQKHLYFCPEREGLICYGAGEHGHWGVHTHQKAFSAFAIAATSDWLDFSDTNLTKAQLLSQALGMLRYNLHTHLEGDFICTDGEKWGHNWIYVLGIERMYHAIEALDAYLTEEDRALLKKVLISESEFILHEYPIEAGLYGDWRNRRKGKDIGNDFGSRNINRPESNIWNGAILYRVASLYPDTPHRAEYIDKARRFFANGISIESDQNSDEIVDGLRIGDVFVGANMFDSYACNHHGYLNIGYMNICLSNIAMLHFFLKARGEKADAMVYHHLHDQWKLIRATTFDDGRLLRIGGDSRARYCYCQDYALPSWALIEDLYGEDCSGLFEGWLKILQQETEANGDGSFLSNRFGHFENLSPVYYTRLESDRANVISMVLYWYTKYAIKAVRETEKMTQWMDDYHGAAFVSGGNRFASFTWEASEKPQGLLLPRDDSALGEWRYNLAGRILGVGRKSEEEVENTRVQLFEGGFLTSGSTLCCSDDFMAEGQLREKMARKQIAFAALPDENTVLCLQYANTLNRTFLSEIAGTFWNIPNDIFNGRKRKLTAEKGSGEYAGGDWANRYETIALGHYVNVDERIGMASVLPLTLVRRGERQVKIKDRENSGTLYAEEICAPYQKEYRWADRDTEIINTGFALHLGGAEETKRLWTSLQFSGAAEVKSISIRGKNGVRYLLAANFAQAEAIFDPAALGIAGGRDLASGTAAEKRLLQPGEALLLAISE